MRDAILAHLSALVQRDTQNPPRAITADHGIFAHVREALGDSFAVSMADHGDGCVSLHAVRGAPRVLFNVHLDTVPVGPGWSRPPLELTVAGGRAYGRGSCDIKGAAAVLLALAAAEPHLPLALLFSSDEEAGAGACIRGFCATAAVRDYELVVVAEPTENVPRLAHRGWLAVHGRFTGVAGHSSEPRALADSAVHHLVRWAERALAEAGAAPEPGVCFNLGVVEGGTKTNVIAGHAEAQWSARLPPGADNDAFYAKVTGLAGQEASWRMIYSGPPLPAPGQTDAVARGWLDALGLPVGPAVRFWTEASLFSAAGRPAVVLGPGDIAQAHAADEWVSLEQLDEAAALYRAIARRGAGG